MNTELDKLQKQVKQQQEEINTLKRMISTLQVQINRTQQRSVKNATNINRVKNNVDAISRKL